MHLIMEESFLHFLWKYRLFSGLLKTTSGEPVYIEHPGTHNHDAGPDFLTAKVRIDGTLWAGNVEIHTKASDWNKHHHDKDPTYQNLILHVVYNDDEELELKAPTLNINQNVDMDIYDRYHKLINNKNWVPCELLACHVDHLIWEQWKNRLTIERLEKKYNEIETLLNKYRNNWEETFYVTMARNFGLNVNSAPFELLAKSLPLNVLSRHKNNILQVEALLYGQAGFLAGPFKDAYPKTLKAEYEHLRNKWKLQPIDANLWRFLRLRPANFPHIRIAQFAQLIYKSTSLFSYIREATQLGDISNLLIVKSSPYWDNHYRFDRKTRTSAKFLGSTAINLILINTVIPFLFAYGKKNSLELMKERALEFLTEIPPEKNHITKHWSAMGIENKNAFHSQAIIYLKKNYCVPKKCLQCPVGKKILS